MALFTEVTTHNKAHSVEDILLLDCHLAKLFFELSFIDQPEARAPVLTFKKKYFTIISKGNTLLHPILKKKYSTTSKGNNLLQYSSINTSIYN